MFSPHTVEHVVQPSRDMHVEQLACGRSPKPSFVRAFAMRVKKNPSGQMAEHHRLNRNSSATSISGNTTSSHPGSRRTNTRLNAQSVPNTSPIGQIRQNTGNLTIKDAMSSTPSTSACEAMLEPPDEQEPHALDARDAAVSSVAAGARDSASVTSGYDSPDSTTDLHPFSGTSQRSPVRPVSPRGVCPPKTFFRRDEGHSHEQNARPSANTMSSTMSTPGKSAQGTDPDATEICRKPTGHRAQSVPIAVSK